MGEFEQDAEEFGTEGLCRSEPEAALQKRHAVEAEIDKERDRHQNPERKDEPGGLGRPPQSLCDVSHVVARLKEQKPNRGDNGEAGSIEEPLEQIDPEHSGDWKLLFARQEQ